jgi:hypothetical protein
VGVHTLTENYEKEGISSMFKNINLYSLFSEGEKIIKKKLCLQNKTRTFTYEALLSYYSFMDRL